MAAASSASLITVPGCSDQAHPGRETDKPVADVPRHHRRGNPAIPKCVIISMDSLDPRLLYLNARGERYRPGDGWLMPEVRSFLEQGTWFEHTRCWLPAATDMNHLNAVAGTSSAQTGILGVSLQLFDWYADGSPRVIHPSLIYARDDNGRPVDTLFGAWKRKWPASSTMFASGKGWVADMFGGGKSGVDIILTGYRRPSYIHSPSPRSYCFPPGQNPDAPASGYQRRFTDGVYNKKLSHFPNDRWVAQAALAVMKAERPDLACIILAQMDDAQHAMGTLVEPDEFFNETGIFGNTISRSRINSSVYRGALVNVIRDIDRQFGLLIKGIRNDPYYRDARIVFYSDHGHVNHRDTLWSNFDSRLNTTIPDILRKAGVITHEERQGRGFFMVGASSIGALHIKGSMDQRRRRALEIREVLATHRVWNERANIHECPWLLAGEHEAIHGSPGLCEPGELFHRYFGYNNRPGTLHYPDCAVFMQKGYQLPVQNRLLANLGTPLPWYLPDNLNLFLGGHGSVDTVPIVMAFQGPGIRAGKVVSDPSYRLNHRISDIAATVSSRFGLELSSTVIGRDRSVDLV